MSKKIDLSAVLFLFLVGLFSQKVVAANDFNPSSILSTHVMLSTEGITIPDMDIVVGYASLAWTPVSGNGQYTVTVINMTTNSLHTQFSTSNTTGALTGLVYGNRYGISVTKAAQTQAIIIDIIDL